MQVRSGLCRGLLASALVAALAGPAGASTFIRASLEDLSAKNSTIVLGEVVNAVSYWNADHSFILTDVTFNTRETIKGQRAPEHTVTLMGGTVGDRTVLIVGGAELVPGHSYLLFLDNTDLPGAPEAITVREHAQGTFEIATKNGELRAISQADRAHLLPDRQGRTDVPGGTDGFVLDSLINELRSLVQSQPEVSR